MNRIDTMVQFSNTLRDAQRAVEAELRGSLMGGDTGRQLVEEVRSLDRNQNRSTFANEAAPGGAPWAPLSPAYAEEKRQAVGDKGILVRTGEMRDSATVASNRHRIARLMSGKLELGTSHPLARKHQFGGQFTEQVPAHTRKLKPAKTKAVFNSRGAFAGRTYDPGRKNYAYVQAHVKRYVLPARPFIGKSAEEHQAILGTITKVLIERMDRASHGRLRNVRLAAGRAAGRVVVVEAA